MVHERTMANVFVRPALAADAERLHALHTASVRGLCGDHYSADIIDGWLLNRSADIYRPIIERGDIFVAVDEERVVGFGEAVPGEIRAIYVDPAEARKGIGTVLMHHAMRIAGHTAHGTIALVSSLNAVAFYERFGFRVTRRTVFPRNEVLVPVAEMTHSQQSL